MPLSCSIARPCDAVESAYDYVHLMDSSEADERVGRLLAGLDETITVLQMHDAHGLRRLLHAYGGMGSFNDVVLTHLNGHPIDPSQEPSVNERLDALRSSMYSDATALLHNLDA